MRNLNVAEVNGKLIVTIDLDGKTTPSSSGKTNIVASTGGNLAITTSKGLVFVGVNVSTK